MNLTTSPLVAGTKWIDFLNLISGHADGRWVYRGLRDESFELVPSVGRNDVCGTAGYSLSDEVNLFDDFQIEASRFASSVDKKLEWLALGQHHGLPTRLLDWSRNPLVAAWFASEQPFDGRPPTNGKIVMVWVDATAISSESDLDPFDPHTKTPKFVRVPPRAARVTAQQGLFSVHPQPDRSWTPAADGFRVEEIIIDVAEKQFFRRMLHVMGVDHARLMSDMDAVCDTLAWRYRDRS